MKMKTLALAVIAKNERHHLDSFAESIHGCFDQVIFVDTGSTDGTRERAVELGFEVHDFEWVHDFAKARENSFSYSKCDYTMWLDLDDLLSDKIAFLKWREGIDSADAWLATYNYAYDKNGNCVCSFARERVFKTDRAMWVYPVHEGIQCKPGFECSMAYAQGWSVNHQRTIEDVMNDRGRNITILEKNKSTLDARMRYYYGKELVDAGKHKEAVLELMTANSDKTLQLHDRLLCIQYAAQAYMALNDLGKVIEVSHMGLMLAPTRAEFLCQLGDAYGAMGRWKESIVWHTAATGCIEEKVPQGQADIIFKHKDCYGMYPRKQIARCFVQMQDWESAKIWAQEAADRYPNDKEAQDLKTEVYKLAEMQVGYKKATEKTDDVVITCLAGLYEWDGEIALTRGVGGSEIAAIKMAEEFVSRGTPCIVFNERKEAKTINGVEYRPLSGLYDYFSKKIPALHVAWRHNHKLTDAKTVVWQHDLFVPGTEDHSKYDKMLVLSPFHKKFVQSIHQIPDEKFMLTKNGIDPKRFDGLDLSQKDPYKLVWSSSPDRGLDICISILDIVRDRYPVTLEIFYGFDNMIKMGKQADVDRYMQLINDRPWITLVGNVAQSELPKYLSKASAWLYATSFDETSCIGALEMILCGVYPIVRKKGALPDTLAQYIDQGMATCIDSDPKKGIGPLLEYADEVCKVIEEKRWQKIVASPENHSWSKVCDQWVEKLLK